MTRKTKKFEDDKVKQNKALEEADPIVPPEEYLEDIGIEKGGIVYQDRRKVYIIESIVRGIFCGYSREKIAEKLGLKTRTVEKYVQQSDKIQSLIKTTAEADILMLLPDTLKRMKKLINSKSDAVARLACIDIWKVSNIYDDGSKIAINNLNLTGDKADSLDESDLKRMPIGDLRSIVEEKLRLRDKRRLSSGKEEIKKIGS